MFVRFAKTHLSLEIKISLFALTLAPIRQEQKTIRLLFLLVNGVKKTLRNGRIEIQDFAQMDADQNMLQSSQDLQQEYLTGLKAGVLIGLLK